ncbi:MAG: Ig-like domain repeat protein, partial [Rhizobiales bacterium]|nr:Ig-like domain repeat protein [Hyphomicrobiales bacterium]
TLTVAVKSREGTPRGDVTIRDVALDSILADRVMLDSNGMASFTTSGLEQGSRTIVASYHGDAKNASAVSTQLMQIVSPEHMHGGQSSR